MNKVTDLLQAPQLNVAGELAVKMLAILEESNPTLEVALAAAEIVACTCRYARSSMPFKSAILKKEDTEYLTKEMTKK